MKKPFSTLPWLIYGNLFYEVYALPYDYMGAFFFGGACRPTPRAVLSSTSICFWIEPIQLLLASLSSLDDVFADESDVLSGMAETISHSPLFYLDLLPFSYITLYTYTPIDVF